MIRKMYFRLIVRRKTRYYYQCTSIYIYVFTTGVFIVYAYVRVQQVSNYVT